jgi:hypothetical protein
LKTILSFVILSLYLKYISEKLYLVKIKNENYHLYIDVKETKYDLTKSPSYLTIGMIISKDSKQIEIVGTKVS